MVLARPISMRGSPKMWQLPLQMLSRARAALQEPPQVRGPLPAAGIMRPLPCVKLSHFIEALPSEELDTSVADKAEHPRSLSLRPWVAAGLQ